MKQKSNWLGLILITVIALFVIKSCGIYSYIVPTSQNLKSFDNQLDAEKEAPNVACIGSHYVNQTKKWQPCMSHEIYVASVQILSNTLDIPIK